METMNIIVTVTLKRCICFAAQISLLKKKSFQNLYATTKFPNKILTYSVVHLY